MGLSGAAGLVSLEGLENGATGQERRLPAPCCPLGSPWDGTGQLALGTWAHGSSQDFQVALKSGKCLTVNVQQMLV